MKTLLIILFSVFILLSAQAETGNRINKTESLAEYYPLQIGNKWLFKTSFYEISTTPSISYHRKEVIGDTLMDNGKNYFIIKEWDRNRFERFDTTTNTIRRYETYDCPGYDVPVYSLNYLPDSTIEWTFCDQIPIEISYDESMGIDNAVIMLEKDFLAIESVGFRKGLGLYYSDVTEISYAHTGLIGAEINGIVWGTLTQVEEKKEVVNQFSLSQNYPNPFNPSTKIKFTIASVEVSGTSLYNTKLIVYDILGREVTTLVNQKLHPGNHEVMFDASSLSSGVYFYRLISGQNTQTKKMILIK